MTDIRFIPLVLNSSGTQTNSTAQGRRIPRGASAPIFPIGNPLGRADDTANIERDTNGGKDTETIMESAPTNLPIPSPQ